MLAISTEKLKKKLKKSDVAYYGLACSLWGDTIPIILPTFLQLVRYGFRTSDFCKVF